MVDLERLANLEKAKILKESLKIVDKLGDSELADMDGEIDSSDLDIEELQELILQARKLKKNRYWKLT